MLGDIEAFALDFLARAQADRVYLISRNAIALTVADQTSVIPTPVAWMPSCVPMLSKAPTPPRDLWPRIAQDSAPDDAADTVHAEHVQRVVVAEHLLEARAGPQADQADHDAEDDRASRREHAAGRG